MNLGTAGGISTNTINTSSTAGAAGWVEMIAQGTISTGDIYAGGTGAAGGDIFLTSRALGVTSISTGGLYLPGAPGGNLYVILNIGSSWSGFASGQTSSFVGVPADVASGTLTPNISGPLSVSVSPGTVAGYYPGGFDTLNITNLGLNLPTWVCLTARQGNLTVGNVVSGSVGHTTLVGPGNITFGTAGSTCNLPANLALISTAGIAAFVGTTQAVTGTNNSIDVSAAAGVTLANGANLIATASAGSGPGGMVFLYAPWGPVVLGTSGNTSGNLINVAGTNGGLIGISGTTGVTDYAVALFAAGTSGAGGTIQVTASGVTAGISLYNAYNASNNYNASIYTGSWTGGAGGILGWGPRMDVPSSGITPLPSVAASSHASTTFPTGSALAGALLSSASVPLDTVPARLSLSGGSGHTGTGSRQHTPQAWGGLHNSSLSGSKQSGTPGAAATPLEVVSTAGATIRHCGADVSISAGRAVNLHAGSILIEARKSTRVVAGEYTVSIAPDTIALMSYMHGVLKVENLWGGGANSLTVERGTMLVARVAPAQEATAGPDRAAVARVLLLDGIVRRRPAHLDLPGGIHVTIADVSITSLLQSSELLVQVTAGKNEADRRLTGKILKMAACVMHLTANLGPYQAPASAQ